MLYLLLISARVRHISIAIYTRPVMFNSQSLLLGIKSSSGYFVSTFLFGLMFGITAASVGLVFWQTMFMSAAVFSASAQFVTLEFWHQPLPLGTIALSVALVSSRNILLGMSMANHFDGHSLLKRVTWLFLLNDPGVVSAFRLEGHVDRFSYVIGYGLSLMLSWLLSTSIGIYAADVFVTTELGALNFAGPLVMATMMILFIKGSGAKPFPWVVSGLVAWVLFEMGTADYLILLLSVAAGVLSVLIKRHNHE